MIRQETRTDWFAIIGSQADIRSCYRQADLIFLPSLYEGLSNSLIEALACECLALCSDIREFSCLSPDQENGFLVPLDEPERIGQKIIKIMQYDEDQLAPIRHQARLSVLPFGPDGYYANLSAMIQQFARSGLARSARSPEKV
jgi:glycosyltransferase involved in cell wall biosynthesis